jgi:hypothetical protein
MQHPAAPIESWSYSTVKEHYAGVSFACKNDERSLTVPGMVPAEIVFTAADLLAA